MSGICPACGTDPGFDVARCPSCGAAMAGPAQGATPAGGAWEKTVMEPAVPKPETGRRPRFDRGREFYEAIDETRGDATPVGLVGPAAADQTIVERPLGPEPNDATVIVRPGRRGVDGPLAYLIERSGVRAGKVHLLRPDTAIGRAEENDIVLGDESVSKRHARIKIEDGKFVFWDLASTNHSRLLGADGVRTRVLEPHPLSDGDTIDLGDARVTFLLVEEAEADDAS